jgi:hypothetical protein
LESSTREKPKKKFKSKREKEERREGRRQLATDLILFLKMLRFVLFVFFRSGPVDHITEALGSLTTSSDDSKDKIPSAPGPSNQRKSDPLTGLAVQRQPIDRREELCQRHVQQLFIRGEQVALVSVLPL